MELVAKPRTERGKKAKYTRAGGNVPAVLYGYKIDNQLVSVDAKEFARVWQEAGESSLVQLNVAGGNTTEVLIHDVQLDPLADVPTHIDFYAVRMDRPIEAEVPLNFTGESAAVKVGGILLRIMHEVHVRALPKNLPHAIPVDIGALAEFEDRIFIKDLMLPEGVEALAEDEQVVALVEAPKTAEELAAEEAAEKAEAAAGKSVEDVEVVGAKKEEQEEGEETEEAKSE